MAAVLATRETLSCGSTNAPTPIERENPAHATECNDSSQKSERRIPHRTPRNPRASVGAPADGTYRFLCLLSVDADRDRVGRRGESTSTIFDEPPGRFNVSKMGHGYGKGGSGASRWRTCSGWRYRAWRRWCSSSTMRCGAFDDDDFFIYIGGLAAAVRSILALASRGRPAAGRAALGIELDPGIGFNITRKFH